MITAETLSESFRRILSATARPAVQTIPAIVMLCSLAKRPGLSTIFSTMKIVEKFKKRGIPTEPLPDGSPNNWLLSTIDTVDELYRALRQDAVVQGAGAPGNIAITATGENAGGPVVATGSNTTAFNIIGLVN